MTTREPLPHALRVTSFGSAWQRVRAIADRDWVMLPLAVVTLAVYLAAGHARRFIPHDEGVLAQSAERVLRGEWPHRNFDDPYTGGLALLHAAAMRAFGTDLLAMRRLLLLTSIGFSAVVYRLTRRVASPALAAFVTWGALVWGMPSYFAALPSWYNLMAATLALLFTVRFTEHGRRTDAALAGVFGGLSLLIKVVGLFQIAAGMLGLLFVALSRAVPAASPREHRVAHGLVRTAALSFAIALALLLPATASVMERLHFTLPGWVLAWVLVRESQRVASRGHAPPLRSLLAMLASYLAGVALPVVVFLWSYAASESLGALVHGVFVVPRQRVADVSFTLSRFWTLLCALPMAAVLLAPQAVSRVIGRPLGLLLLAAVSCLLLFAGGYLPVYAFFWFYLRALVPLATLGCALWLNRELGADSLQRARLFCVAACVALVSLVQYPYAHGVYFLYVAPLLVVLLAWFAHQREAAARRLWFVLACLHFGFALLWLNSGGVRTLGVRYVPDPSRAYLDLPRAGLDVAPEYAVAYTNLVRVIEAYSAADAYIYAAPDCPEVYFVSGRRNPTRTFYDLFDADFAGPQEARAQRILETLERHQVELAVVCKNPEFSGPMSAALIRRLELRYPRRVDVSWLFSVRFRDRIGPQPTAPRP